MKKSILLLGNYRPTQPLAKMLSSLGYDVVAGTLGPETFFKKSRYITNLWDHSDVAEDPDRFFEELCLYCELHPELEAIFPVLENYVRLFSEYPQWLSKLPLVIMAEAELVKKCLNKSYMMKLATRCSAPIAPFSKAQDENELQISVSELGFPLVIRPAISQNLLLGKKAVYISSKNEFEALDIDWRQHPKGLILQSQFEGIRHNIYFAALDGKICRYLHAKIIRTTLLDGSGLALEGITIHPEATMKRHCEKLLDVLNYSGIGCIQFLVNERTGESSFLEINPRVAGNAIVAEYAGLELGKFQIDLALTGKPDQTVIIGRENIRFTWTSEDIMAAKRAWRKGEISAKEVTLWLLKAVGSGMRANLHILFSWSDPKPGLAALARCLPGINHVKW
jgi:predicted ATP-grasp superfamily ATP-dependent carboligase